MLDIGLMIEFETYPKIEERKVWYSKVGCQVFKNFNLYNIYF
jgi:hypothetical protein